MKKIIKKIKLIKKIRALEYDAHLNCLTYISMWHLNPKLCKVGIEHYSRLKSVYNSALRRIKNL